MKRLRLERTYPALLEDVWALWTTKDGIESWWGPEGFDVVVHHIELRAGGSLLYAMRAIGRDQVSFMKAHGMPLVTEHRITFTEIVPMTRLAYVHLADFVPGVAAYDVATEVELEQLADGVKMTLTFDPMHDPVWTERAVMGWTSELGKLAHALVQKESSR